MWILFPYSLWKKSENLLVEANASVSVFISNSILKKSLFLIISFTFCQWPGVKKGNEMCMSIISEIILPLPVWVYYSRFAVFAERILPISTAALLASELPLDYWIQRKKKITKNTFLFGVFKNKIFHRQG